MASSTAALAPEHSGIPVRPPIAPVAVAGGSAVSLGGGQGAVADGTPISNGATRNPCPCGCTRNTLQTLLAATRGDPEIYNLNARIFHAGSDPRNEEAPRCSEGTRIRDHPSAPGCQHPRTDVIHAVLIAGMVALAVSLMVGAARGVDAGAAVTVTANTTNTTGATAQPPSLLWFPQAVATSLLVTALGLATRGPWGCCLRTDGWPKLATVITLAVPAVPGVALLVLLALEPPSPLLAVARLSPALVLGACGQWFAVVSAWKRQRYDRSAPKELVSTVTATKMRLSMALVAAALPLALAAFALKIIWPGGGAGAAGVVGVCAWGLATAVVACDLVDWHRGGEKARMDRAPFGECCACVNVLVHTPPRTRDSPTGAGNPPATAAGASFEDL